MNLATVRAELEALLTAHAHEAASLDVPAMQALLPVLEQARGELNRDLSAWIAAGKGADRYTPQAYRNSMLAIEGSLDAMRARLNPLLAAVLGDHDAIARRLANTHTGRELALMAQAGFSDILPDVPLRVAAGLVQSRNAPMQRYDTSAARYTGDVARDIRRELAVGVVRGENLDQLVARMQGIGGPAGAVAVRGIAGTAGAVIEVIPEGLFRRYEYWAERIVRTELAHAYNEQLQDITNDLRATTHMTDLTRRWDASSDGRLCPRCQDMHGALADPKTDMFPNDVVGPPLHPNCRCRAGLWRSSWERFMDRGYTDPGASRTPTVPPPPLPLPPPGPGPAPLTPPGPPAPPRRPRAAPGTGTRRRAAAAPAVLPPAPPVAPNPALPVAPTFGAADAVPAAAPSFGTMTVEQRLAHLGIDVRQVADAASAVERLAKAEQAAQRAYFAGTPQRVAAEAASRGAQGTVRAFADRIVQWFGGAVHDPAMTARAWVYRVEALGRRRLNGYHGWDGIVAVDRKRHALTVRALNLLSRGRAAEVTADMWDTLRTLVHETVHGHSPLKAAAYVRHGAAIEEATTELAARRMMRDTFGTYGHGSYPDVINRLHVATGAGTDVLERAAVRFHGPRPADAPVSHTADDHLRLFARWFVQTRDGLTTVPAATDPRVVQAFNAMLPHMTKGP